MKFNLTIQKPSLPMTSFIFLNFISIQWKDINFYAFFITGILTYLYTDYWLFILHLFLDQEKNKQAYLKPIRLLADEFQSHHGDPSTIIPTNHVNTLNYLVNLTVLPGIFSTFILKKSLNIFSLCTLLASILGIIASTNHYYCHAITHKNKLRKITKQYKLFEYCQRLHLLPTNKHHRIHHTPPFDCNWNFLNGNYKLYTWLYNKSGKSFNILRALFYTTNPITISWIYCIYNF